MKNGDRMTCQIKGLEAGVLYVSFDYIDGTASVQWSKVARLESNQLFIVKTEDGSVYTGRLNTAETPVGKPVKIQIVESPEKEVVLGSPQIVEIVETSDRFWRRFNGELSFGVIYSKGNESTQYTLGSQTVYLRERWWQSRTSWPRRSHSLVVCHGCDLFVRLRKEKRQTDSAVHLGAFPKGISSSCEGAIT